MWLRLEKKFENTIFFLWRFVSFKHQTFYPYISKWLSEFILILIYKIKVYTSEELKFSSTKLSDNHSWNIRLNFIFEFYVEPTAICWFIGICVDTHRIKFQI